MAAWASSTRPDRCSLNRLVALKMILAGHFARSTDVRRFRERPRPPPTSTIRTSCPIYEVGEHEGQQYFSMKLIDGGSLAQSPTPGRNRASGGESVVEGRPGGPLRPPARRPAPRPEAGEHPARSEGARTSPTSAWPSGSRPSRTDADGCRSWARRATWPPSRPPEKVITTAADVTGWARSSTRSDRTAAVPGRDAAGHRAASPATGSPTAADVEPDDRPRPGDDCPEVPGEGAGQALRVGGGPGRRPGALASGEPILARPTHQAGARRQVGTAAPGGRRPGGRQRRSGGRPARRRPDLQREASVSALHDVEDQQTLARERADAEGERIAAAAANPGGTPPARRRPRLGGLAPPGTGAVGKHPGVLRPGRPRRISSRRTESASAPSSNAFPTRSSC